MKYTVLELTQSFFEAMIVIIRKSILFFLFFLSAHGAHDCALGWHDETHLSVSKAAEYHKWYNSVGADMAKLKAGTVEKFNHYFNNSANREVTAESVLQQVSRYNNPNDTEGHLYGAIIASVRDYIETTREGKYGEYYLAFCAHYVADLSQPFHNMTYDTFNQKHHSINDGTVEKEVLKHIARIETNIHEITLNPDRLDADLAEEIARIANRARMLGFHLKKEDRDMTTDEAYRQLGHSASLFKAILRALRGEQKSE